MNPASSLVKSLLLLAGAIFYVPLHAAEDSISQLEEKRDAIRAELDQLATFSLRSGVGSIGFRSLAHAEPDHTEWVRIELGREMPIDQIVVVPAIWRAAQSGFEADGFPLEFQLIAGSDNDAEGKVIASFTERDGLLPRAAPLLVDCPSTTASWVKLNATRLAPRHFDNQYILELAEIMVFHGPDNVALHQPVTTSSVDANSARDPAYLVDGFVPYLMDAAKGENSIAVISTTPDTLQGFYTIDLGAPDRLDYIHLHTVEQSDTVPQPFSDDLGIPRLMHIDGANQPDFSDAVRLLDLGHESVYETGPIMMHRLPGEAPYRYIRLTAAEPYTSFIGGKIQNRFGFSEIELISGGENVALGKTVSANFPLRNPSRSFSSMTDGRNLYGDILPIRQWMYQLARRHELEKALPLVQRQLDLKYARQQVIVTRLMWLAAALAAMIAIGFLGHRILRQRQASLMKERFAADLHDELGANLHAIGFLGTHLKDILDSPEKLLRTVDEIKALTDRTGEATRYCIDSQTAKEIHTDLAADLRRTTRRIIANLDYSLDIEGGEILNALKPRTRTDLFLFFKESLVNINRHADASAVRIQLTADTQHVRLRICDDGRGLSDGEKHAVPASLQRRAKLLGAKVSVEPSESGGTCISLDLRTRRLL
ncbi:MAG: ATP-binding protein [Luteolibacter sp.]